MNNRFLTATSLASALSLSIIFVCIPSITIADEGDESRYGSHTEAGDDGIHQSIWEYQTVTTPGNNTQSTPTTAGDDTTRQSNDTVPASEAGPYFDFAHCAVEKNPFGDDPLTHGSWVCGACQFFCVWGLEVGGDSVGVGGGELGEGLFPVGGGASLDEACGGCSFVGGFACVCEALGGSFVFDVADG